MISGMPVVFVPGAIEPADDITTLDDDDESGEPVSPGVTAGVHAPTRKLRAISGKSFLIIRKIIPMMTNIAEEMISFVIRIGYRSLDKDEKNS
jgi:hypothetical protein